MIPKLTCLLLRIGQAEFSELVQLRATSPNEALQVLLRGKKMTFTTGIARNVAKDDLEAQREALSSHGYSAYSSSGSKTPRRIMSVSQPVKVISSRPSDSRFEVSSKNTSFISSARNTLPSRVRRYAIGPWSTCE